MKVLGRKTSGNVQKVLFLLEELKLPYEREDYGRQFNNTQTAEYLRMNPNAKVPTLVDGSLAIWESNTILRYVASKAKSALYPADLGKRAQVEKWMDWQLASLNNPYLAMFREAKLEPAKRSADFDTQQKDLGAQLSILDKNIRKCVAGEELTIADICLAPIVYRCLRFGVDLPELANVKRWDAAIASRDAFKKATAA
ncbi:MAG: glutathione S-transferase family protein [Betaproteobacteria bacterium]|nr:MAG: glutathione S-transferase family protein [Betaproteobacteria bacterium]